MRLRPRPGSRFQRRDAAALGLACFRRLPTVSCKSDLDSVEKLLIVERLQKERDGSLFQHTGLAAQVAVARDNDDRWPRYPATRSSRTRLLLTDASSSMMYTWVAIFMTPEAA